MAETVSQFEEIPETYPTEDDDHLWQRIEAYCARRWTARSVVWIVDGPGAWKPPLAPYAITSTEIWNGGEYEPVTLDASPMGGLYLPRYGPYSISATVGADTSAPAAVYEAFDRLKAYAEADHGGLPGVSSYSINTGQLSEQFRRDPAHMARALEMSGAADLLRPYRRA